MQSVAHTSPGAPALVTGASGQDGGLLVARLVTEGFRVHAVVRRAASFPWEVVTGSHDAVQLYEMDLSEPDSLAALVDDVRPVELYNLAGVSSVSQSFLEPALTWLTNATAVANLLEAIRTHTPETRMYQASSSEMFGWIPSGSVVHGEEAPLFPQSPYAAAKAAAHLLCTTYRRAYGLRIACGILFNHESRRRGPTFLTRKVTDHVRALRFSAHPLGRMPLVVGNLKARRDWGFAPDYVDGMCRILRQVDVRASVSSTVAEPDTSKAYRDYVLGTGESRAVWELIDRAFQLAGFELNWDLTGDDASRWGARYAQTEVLAVVVDPSFLRPSDPLVIEADPSRARTELAWAPRVGLDAFLRDMLFDTADDTPE